MGSKNGKGQKITAPMEEEMQQSFTPDNPYQAGYASPSAGFQSLGYPIVPLPQIMYTPVATQPMLGFGGQPMLPQSTMPPFNNQQINSYPNHAFSPTPQFVTQQVQPYPPQTVALLPNGNHRLFLRPNGQPMHSSIVSPAYPLGPPCQKVPLIGANNILPNNNFNLPPLPMSRM